MPVSSQTYDFDKVVDRRDSSATKWQRYAGRDVVPMWVGDTDFEAATEILDAIRERVGHGVLGYTKPPDSLRQQIVERLAERGNWQIDPDWLVFLPGLVSALFVACQGCCRPQGTVAIPASIYGPFRLAVERTGRRVVSVPLREQAGRHVIVGEELDRAVEADTELLLLCNPHNPGGAVYSRKELESIADVCLKRDLIICSDEVHCDLIYEGKHCHIAQLSEEVAAHTITLLAPSKTFNIAGMSCSFAIISDAALRRRFRRACHALPNAVNLLGYTAAEAAYRHGDIWLRQMLAYLVANRDWLHGRLGTIEGIRTAPPQSTFFSWIDLRSRGIEQVGEHFENFGLGVSDGVEFGSPGWVRLNFGTRRALLEEGFDRFKRALDAVN